MRVYSVRATVLLVTWAASGFGCGSSRSERTDESSAATEAFAEAPTTDVGDAALATDSGGDAGVDAVACVPTTCTAQGAQCGTLPDGCGGTIFCGICPEPGTCSDTSRETYVSGTTPASLPEPYETPPSSDLFPGVTPEYSVCYSKAGDFAAANSALQGGLMASSGLLNVVVQGPCEGDALPVGLLALVHPKFHFPLTRLDEQGCLGLMRAIVDYEGWSLQYCDENGCYAGAFSGEQPPIALRDAAGNVLASSPGDIYTKVFAQLAEAGWVNVAGNSCRTNLADLVDPRQDDRDWAVAALQTAWLIPLTDASTVTQLTDYAKKAAAQVVSINGNPVPCGRQTSGSFVGWALPTQIANVMVPPFEASIPVVQTQNSEEDEVEATVMLTFRASLQQAPTPEQFAQATAAVMGGGMQWTDAYKKYMGDNPYVVLSESGGSKDPLGGGGCGTGCQ